MQTAVRREAWVNAISNTLFNGVIAYLLLRSGPALSWQGQHSFVPDIIATAFILPFIVALIIIPLGRRKLRQGKLTAITLGGSHWLHRLVAWLSPSLWRAACQFGLIGVLVFVPPALLALVPVDSLTPAHYAILKGLWAGLIAGLLAVPMLMHALSQPEINHAK